MGIPFNSEQLLTVNEVADFLGLNPQTIYRWIWSGKIPSIKIGRAVRIKFDDLQQTLDKSSENDNFTSGDPVRSSQVSSRKRKPIWE